MGGTPFEIKPQKMNNLKIFSATHTPLVLNELQGFFDAKKKEAKLLTPHLLASMEHIEEFTLRGGKNIRSLLTVLGYRLAGGTDAAIYRAAAGVEMFHKFIMSIDDMADRDEKRYGGPTLWKAYEEHFQKLGWPDYHHHGQTFGEIDATLMSSFTTELIRTSKFPAELLLQVLGIVDEIMYWQTIGGWQIHYFQNHQKLSEANEAEYIKGLELVTAQYSFVAPLKCGVILAGQEKNKVLLQVLTNYSQNVGRAFQMQDDILGVFGDTKETGKPVGNDIREGKKTLLLQRAYQTANSKDQQFLETACGNTALTEKDVQRVQKIIQETGSLAYSQNLAQESIQKGIAVLEKLDQTEEEIQVLKELAEFVLARKK